MDTSTNQSNAEKRVVYPSFEAAEERKEEIRKNRIRRRKVLVALAWTAVVLVVCFLVLFLSSKIGRFESIGDMLYFINQHFAYSELFGLS